MSESSWFSVRIILERTFHDAIAASDRLYEDRIIILRAETEEEARSKGEQIGRTRREEFKNTYGETVTWEFREVVDVIQLLDDSIEDGTEVYWSFIGEEEFERLREVYDR